jgi:holo-[acyl-carrier protein] synthase
MILGIGSDTIDIRRIEKTLGRYGDRFVSRIFTAIERQKSDRRAERAASYARRGVYWRDLGVVNAASGKPTMVLTGPARERLKSLVPPGHEPHIHVTITDDFPYAQALVIIEALPKPGS